MIRTELYNVAGETGEERTRQIQFNTRFRTAKDKAARLFHDHLPLQLTRDSFKVPGNEDVYFLRIFMSDGFEYIHCTCDAGTYNQPCYHALSVIKFRIDNRAFQAFVPRDESNSTNNGITFFLEKGERLPAFDSAVRVNVEPVK